MYCLYSPVIRHMLLHYTVTFTYLPFTSTPYVACYTHPYTSTPLTHHYPSTYTPVGISHDISQNEGNC